MHIFCTVSVAFSCTFCTDGSDFDTEDCVTFYAGETKASFPFFAHCDTVEEGNEVVRLVLEVQDEDRHLIAIIGNDHIEVVIVGKRHTTAITVLLSSVIVNVNADRNHLQVTYHAKEDRQTTLTHTTLCIFAQLCIILTHVQLCIILTHVQLCIILTRVQLSIILTHVQLCMIPTQILRLLCFPHLLYYR